MMRRFWYEGSLHFGQNVKIDGELFHHLIGVCRFKIGQQFELLVPQQAWLVQIQEINKKNLIISTIQTRSLPLVSLPKIHLALSICKWNKMDLIVEKAVELGANSIYPFVSDHSFVREVSLVSMHKWERWNKIVRQATQQTGRGDLMEVFKSTTLTGLISHLEQEKKWNDPSTLILFPYEGNCQKTLKQVLGPVVKRSLTDVWVFVGSEGGFSAEEVERFRRTGLEPVTLGEQILRVETACLALLSILKYELG
ncbi:MAG: 16S rRNA (uracil(1498)-N(3))-methyltransferase [Bdellovibrionales bacterium]|nr:16S rRNA (uracil(1498)-N(3))-methyltransferase [Bdellovibrionales bacterium]